MIFVIAADRDGPFAPAKTAFLFSLTKVPVSVKSIILSVIEMKLVQRQTSLLLNNIIMMTIL